MTYTTVSENVDYIRKEGKWKGTDKAETSVVGTFQEWGCKPSDSAGKRADMRELFQMIQDGMSNYEIIASNQDYIAQLDTIDRLRTTVLTEKYKNDDRKDLRVIYIYGETGTGKTSGVLKAHGASNVYRVTDYKHPFDGYNCQPVICFDEFRSSLPISAMLNYCDIYPIELPARYNNKFACYETVYIISNWSLEQQYLEAQYSDRESWIAFLRRIHEVRVYKATGIHEYKSVKDYFDGHFPSIQNPVSPHATPQISDEEFNRLMGK